MCTPSFMCKFPFSGREFVAGSRTRVRTLGRASAAAARPCGGHSLCETVATAAAAPWSSLRLAIDCMPVATREAMLAGVRRYERIIVGAYIDEHGGVCPMLAAHRCGGRTDFLSFAKSWDRFARARGRARAATARELRILVAQLEASLASGVETSSSTARSQSTARSWRARAGAAARRSRRRRTRRVGYSRDGCAAGGRTWERATVPRRLPHTAHPRRSQRAAERDRAGVFRSASAAARPRGH